MAKAGRFGTGFILPKIRVYDQIRKFGLDFKTQSLKEMN